MQQWHYVLFLPLSCDLWLCRRKKKHWMCLFTVHTLARLYRKHFDLVCTCDSWVNWIKWMLWEEKSRKKIVIIRLTGPKWHIRLKITANLLCLVIFLSFLFSFAKWSYCTSKIWFTTDAVSFLLYHFSHCFSFFRRLFSSIRFVAFIIMITYTLGRLLNNVLSNK